MALSFQGVPTPNAESWWKHDQGRIYPDEYEGKHGLFGSKRWGFIPVRNAFVAVIANEDHGPDRNNPTHTSSKPIQRAIRRPITPVVPKEWRESNRNSICNEHEHVRDCQVEDEHVRWGSEAGLLQKEKDDESVCRYIAEGEKGKEDCNEVCDERMAWRKVEPMGRSHLFNLVRDVPLHGDTIFNMEVIEIIHESLRTLHCEMLYYCILRYVSSFYSRKKSASILQNKIWKYITIRLHLKTLIYLFALHNTN